jgi:hypothetical protein
MEQTNTTRSILIVMIGVLVAGSSLTAIHTLSADSTKQSHINDNNNNIIPARQQQPVIQNAAISPSNEGDGRRGGVGGDGRRGGVGGDGISNDISVGGNVSADTDTNIGVSGEVEEQEQEQQEQLQVQQQAVPISNVRNKSNKKIEWLDCFKQYKS